MINYPVKFSAAVLTKINKPLQIKELEFKGPLKRGQILVKLFYSGICGKQIDEIMGVGGKDYFIPHLLGHEGTGVILDIGPGVKKVKKNDHVVLHWMKGSGIQSETPKYHEKNKIINAGWVTTFNELAVISENRLTKISKKSNHRNLTLYGCAVTTGCGVVFNQTSINKKTNIAIFGCGGVGLFAIQAAKIFNPKNLVAIDINKKALLMAKKLGASQMINSSLKNFDKKIQNITNNKGFDYIISTVGNNKVISESLKYLSTPGNYIQVGVPKKNTFVKVDFWKVMHCSNITGSLGGKTFPDKDIPHILDLEKKKKINVSRLISKIYKFKQINLAIERVRKQKSFGRVLIKFI